MRASLGLMMMRDFRQLTRTTMVVKLHPGQTKRLSAYLEDQVELEM